MMGSILSGVARGRVHVEGAAFLMELILVIGPYYRSKLELKSNSSEILRVNCKFFCDFTPT